MPFRGCCSNVLATNDWEETICWMDQINRVANIEISLCYKLFRPLSTARMDSHPRFGLDVEIDDHTCMHACARTRAHTRGGVKRYVAYITEVFMETKWQVFFVFGLFF